MRVARSLEAEPPSCRCPERRRADHLTALHSMHPFAPSAACRRVPSPRPPPKPKRSISTCSRPSFFLFRVAPTPISKLLPQSQVKPRPPARFRSSDGLTTPHTLSVFWRHKLAGVAPMTATRQRLRATALAGGRRETTCQFRPFSDRGETDWSLLSVPAAAHDYFQLLSIYDYFQLLSIYSTTP
jgi:hypothetical protein